MRCSRSRTPRHTTVLPPPGLDTARPAKVAYRGNALTTTECAFDKSGADDPEVVVTAVIASLSGRAGKAMAVVGKGTGAFMLQSRLPVRLRDRLDKSALVLTKALKTAA